MLLTSMDALPFTKLLDMEVDICALLLDAGSVDAVNKDGRTPLCLAFCIGKCNVAAYYWTVVRNWSLSR